MSVATGGTVWGRRLSRRPFPLIWLAAGVVASLPGVGVSSAEQPGWTVLREPLYVVLRHLDGPSSDELASHHGLWRFTPATRGYERFASFYFNAKGTVIPTSYGEGAFLTALDDRLLFESWPAYIEFEPASGRVLRRYSPLADPEYRGWALQGPAVVGSSAVAAGLAPGVYGFPYCYYGYLNFGDIPVECIQPTFPGIPGPYPYYGVAGLYERPASPDGEGFALVADIRGQPEGELSGWNRLSFDPGRKGFWLAAGKYSSVGYNGVAFYPVVGGAIQPADSTRRLFSPDIVADGHRADLFFYDPMTDHFFLRRVAYGWPYDGMRLFELDQDLNIVAELGRYGPDGSRDPMPWTLARLPETLPTEYEQTLPIVAHTPGNNQTYWTSDVWLYNPSSATTTVGIRRVTVPTAAPRTVELAAHASVRIPDALSWVGGGPTGDGTKHDALVLTSPYRWGEQVQVASRTFTPSSDPAERDAGGTMGQGVVAVPGRLGYSNHLQDIYFTDLETYVGRPAQLILDPRTPGRYRHNLGIVNDHDEALQLTLTWGYTDGGPDMPWPPAGARQTVTVQPHKVVVVNIEGLFPQANRDSEPAQIAVTADRPAVLFYSQVDNLTGDGTFVPFAHMFLQGGREARSAIPAVAHLPGEHNSAWTTDLYANFVDIFSGDAPCQYGTEDCPKAYFHPAWPTSCGGATAGGGEVSGYLVGVPPFANGQMNNWLWWRTIFPDVTQQFGPCQGDLNVRGALELRTGSWMTGYARTYTTRTDEGTYGDVLPIYPEHGWPVQHFAGIELSSHFRANLGLYNGDASHSITHRLTLYDATGQQVAQRELVLHPWENILDRLERMLGLQVGDLPNGTYGLTVLPLDNAAEGVQGRSWAFVSLIDNVTNDPANWW
jgi:hypothetical protein